MIPCTHNHAGFPDGISGAELIARMKEQAQRYGAGIEDGFVSRLEREATAVSSPNGAAGRSRRKTVLLATGVTNRRPPMDEDAA